MLKNRIGELFGIQYPIVQGGMAWCSGWRLASAVSNHGGLGLLGAASMHPETLEEHIHKMKAATNRPFGVNIPLFYPELDRLMEIIVKEKIKIVFTSAGSPDKLTLFLKQHGIKVAHVVSSAKFARKCEQAGVDAIVAEGFEAGGHNGREETTTLALIPAVRQAVSLPVMAAGGIASGRAMLAAMCLGAEGVQIGSLFALTDESSAHPNFKKMAIEAQEGDTFLSLKKITPVRLLKNKFFEQVQAAESRGDSIEELRNLLGHGRAKKGMLEGDLEEGELEICEIVSTIRDIVPVSVRMQRLIDEYRAVLQELAQNSSFQF